MKKQKTIRKRLHDINTFMASSDNETYLCGRDEHGREFHLVIPTIEVLEWLDIPHMKQRCID